MIVSAVYNTILTEGQIVACKFGQLLHINVCTLKMIQQTIGSNK